MCVMLRDPGGRSGSAVWHEPAPVTGRSEVTVKLNNRIVLTPYAAKRMQALLGEVIKQYESRFGALELQGRS